jgi:hypothetical protein
MKMISSFWAQPIERIGNKIIVNTTHLLVVERFYYYIPRSRGGIEINFAANYPYILARGIKSRE